MWLGRTAGEGDETDDVADADADDGGGDDCQ